jgi:Methyltransferase domain
LEEHIGILLPKKCFILFQFPSNLGLKRCCENMEHCKICDNESKVLFKKIVLHKYDAEYFQCVSCHFIQVKNPHWLDEAYKEAISSLDTGLVSRNLFLSDITKKIILKNFDASEKFIDYGGGYGLLVRLMRDKGFDFYRQDNFCENLFALHFDMVDLHGDDSKFELLTAFELFEHLENPLTETEEMLKLSDSILFSTELQPNNNEDLENWWYLTPESGQHISFYTEGSLQALARKFGLNLYTDNGSNHILTKRTLYPPPFANNKLLHAVKKYFRRVLSRIPSYKMKSLLKDDYKKIKHLESKT